MKNIREAIGNLLQSDDILLAMLAENKSWADETQSGKEYSIIPVLKSPLSMMPYITIMYLSDTQTGYMLKDAVFMIRCYNATDKTFVEIDEVLERVIALLHRHRFTDLDGNVNVQTEYNFTGTELEDQAYQQNFREAQFSILYL
jgi:hypothetical protein